MAEKVLVCGASGGLGQVVAAHLADEGMVVHGTMRDPSGDARVPMRAMDVTDDASVAACIDGFVDEVGGLDVVVNCCNRMILGSVEETSMAEVEDVYAVNVLGAIRVCRTALPHLRSQGHGKLINMSSLGGVLPVPFLSAYTSAKFALEAFSEALHHEVRHDGVRVVIMQPVAMHMDRPDTGAHLEVAAGATADSRTQRMVERMAADTHASKLEPIQVARAIGDVIRQPHPKLRQPMDRARPLGLVRRLAPQRVIDRLIDQLIPAA